MYVFTWKTKSNRRRTSKCVASELLALIWIERILRKYEYEQCKQRGAMLKGLNDKSVCVLDCWQFRCSHQLCLDLSQLSCAACLCYCIDHQLMIATTLSSWQFHFILSELQQCDKAKAIVKIKTANIINNVQVGKDIGCT